MSGRDRIVLMVVVVMVALGGGWMLLVSPERQEASRVSAEVALAQSQLSAAEGQLATARSAQAKYASAYASIVSLGKAVPASEEVPSLIYQLDQASSSKSVEFASIVSGAGAASTTPAASGSASGNAATAAPGAAASPAAAASPGATTTVAAGFTQMPFTFVFNGTYFDLEHLFSALDRHTMRSASGLQVSGRLLTIQSLKLSPLGGGGPQVGRASSSKATQLLTGTITATAYVLPASQGLTAGATPAAPGATAASATAGGSSPTAPAIAKVTP